MAVGGGGTVVAAIVVVEPVVVNVDRKAGWRRRGEELK